MFSLDWLCGIMYIQTEMFSLDWLFGMYIRTETYSLDWLCGMYITNGNICLGLTVWDVLTTGTDWACIIVFDRSPVAHDLILPSVCDRGPISDGFWVVWEGPPYRTLSLGDGLEFCRGKGLKTVCIAARCTSEPSLAVPLLSPLSSDSHDRSTSYRSWTYHWY